MPESTSLILNSYTAVQCFKPYLGNNKLFFRKLRKYSLTWFLHSQKSLSTSKIIPSPCPGHTWELTKLEKMPHSESFKKLKKYIMCTTAEGKVILLDKPDDYSWKEWHQKLYISTTEKKHTVEEIQNKRHARPVALHCSFSRSSEAGPGPLLPSAGWLLESLFTVAQALTSVSFGAFILAWSGLPERLWLRLRLRRLRCLALCGLGLRDLVFMRTTVLSSSELKSELSEELCSTPVVGSWIWIRMNKYR